jgi:hypothetical protein
MGAGSGAEPGLIEWRLGNSMATGGEIFESRASEGWVGGRVVAELAPEAVAVAVEGVGAKDKEGIEEDVRGVVRGAGREN